MFDPHRTRRNNRRYYTKKGQVIQAKNISVPFTIDRSKVDAYKEYIIKNNLISFPTPPSPPTPPPTPPSPSSKISIDSVSSSAISQPFPTNQFGYSGGGGPIDISGFNPPRILIQIQEQQSNYRIVIYMFGTMTSGVVEERSYYVVFGLGSQYSDYDIKFLSGGQIVFSVQDQVGDNGDNTTFLLPKSKYSISLPA